MVGIKVYQKCKKCGDRVEFTKKGICFGCTDEDIKPKQVAFPKSEKDLLNQCTLDLFQSEQKRIKLVELIEKINKQNRILNNEVKQLLKENERLLKENKTLNAFK
jgi:hypothetical protein